MSAPVKHTCPDIDSVIKRIKSAQRAAWDMFKRSEKGTDEHDAFKDIENDLDGLESELESLRDSNSELRAWGEELEIQVSDLEEQVSALEEDKKHLSNALTI